ncbi:MAG: WD40/YVTN/BNR-like repeat-containing protein [Halorientalis sp.]
MVTIYAAMEDALLVVTGEPGDWQVTERLADHRLECVLATPARPDRVLVGTFDDGLYRRPDGGGDETSASNGGFERVGAASIDSPSVMSLAASPADPDVVWVGTEPSAISRSSDGGTTWEHRPGLTDLPSAGRWSFPPRPETHHVRWIEVDPHHPERLYVGIEAGAFVRTDDAGATWQDHPEGARYDNHTLETHPDREGLVYTAAGDGFALSRDGGDTWEHPQNGLDHRYCWSVVADPGDPDRLAMSAARDARQAHYPGAAQSYVYRRVDGDDWTRVDSDVLPTGEGVLRAVLATTGDPGVVYAANNYGLYRSDDTGGSWLALDVPWPDRFETQTCRGLVVLD